MCPAATVLHFFHFPGTQSPPGCLLLQLGHHLFPRFGDQVSLGGFSSNWISTTFFVLVFSPPLAGSCSNRVTTSSTILQISPLLAGFLTNCVSCPGTQSLTGQSTFLPSSCVIQLNIYQPGHQSLSLPTLPSGYYLPFHPDSYISQPIFDVPHPVTNITYVTPACLISAISPSPVSPHSTPFCLPHLGCSLSPSTPIFINTTALAHFLFFGTFSTNTLPEKYLFYIY